MAIIDVYRYKVFSKEQGTFLDTDSPVYATHEKIEKLGAQPIKSSLLKIDESQLNDQGFYHPSSRNRPDKS